MPRNGAGIYSYPVGTPGVPNTTIESTKYNTYIGDVEQDLNIPRPIVAGGTGANNARDAMINLSGEFAGQLVTNYDSYPFTPGSFFSAPGATGAPDGVNTFSGICHQANPASMATSSTQMFLEARAHDGTGNKAYYREKNTTWGPWVLVSAVTDANIAAKVSKIGDVMSGPLTLNYNGPIIDLNKTVNPSASIFKGSINSVTRWEMHLGGTTPESGANAGSNFGLYRFSDAGAFLGPAIEVIRSTGQVILTGPATLSNTLAVTGTSLLNGVVTANGDVNAGGIIKATSGRVIAQHVTTPSFAMNDGTNAVAIFNGGSGTIAFGAANALGVPTSSLGAMDATGKWTFHSYVVNVAASFGCVPRMQHVAGTGGGIFLNASGVPDALFVGTNAGTGDFRVYSTASNTNVLLVSGATTQTLFMGSTGRVQLGLGQNGRAGALGAFNALAHNWNWTGTALEAWIDASNFGNVTLTSDYRTKKDVEDLGGTWGVVKALRPIKYTQAEFSPPSHLAHIDELEKAARTEEEMPDTGPLFHADDIERWGFIAHELQETLVPSAATGEKDSYDTVQSPNPWTVIAALTSALQEAMARIEALEAR